MKKRAFLTAAVVLLTIALCAVYLLTPIRPAIAKAAANSYLQSHYSQ